MLGVLLENKGYKSKRYKQHRFAALAPNPTPFQGFSRPPSGVSRGSKAQVTAPMRL